VGSGDQIIERTEFEENSVTDDSFELEKLRLPPGQAHEKWLEVPVKIQKRRRHFVKVPWTWVERLKNATGQTYRVAIYLLYLHWKGKGGPIKLANGMLKIDGVPPQTKRRALRDLQRRGLITVEWQPRKSPIVKLLK
jgi:hypothetical protein